MLLNSYQDIHAARQGQKLFMQIKTMLEYGIRILEKGCIFHPLGTPEILQYYIQHFHKEGNGFQKQNISGVTTRKKNHNNKKQPKTKDEKRPCKPLYLFPNHTHRTHTQQKMFASPLQNRRCHSAAGQCVMWICVK